MQLRCDLPLSTGKILTMADERESATGEDFLEFRKKIQEATILSASMERLLKAIHFTGRVSVVVQNGRVLKSGYEEGYFTRRWDDRQL